MKFDDFEEDEENLKEKKKKKFIKKYKTEIIIEIIIVVITLFLLFLSILDFSKPKTPVNYLDLNGDEIVTMAQNTKYIEFGYKAYNSKGEDLTDKVKITSNLDTSKIGEYKITYTIGNITKIRKIIINKSEKYATINLEKVNDDTTVYINLGDQYIEPGYKAYDGNNRDLSDKVKITGEVDTSKRGKYTLVYSVMDEDNILATSSRTVIVINMEINLKLTNTTYTNRSVDIEASTVADFFDYLELPDGTKVKDKNGTYTVKDNGIYVFKIHNQKDGTKEEKIEVSNIDRTPPEGKCKISYNNDKSTITISATDISGINKFIYKNEAYTSDKITVSDNIENADIFIYDNAGNVNRISCEREALPTPVITSVSSGGVIINVKAKKAQADIAGYYFSYTNTRPDKNTGGYLTTANTSVDVVRLPGKTYIWVEDKMGRISKPMTIDIDSNTIPFTDSGYTILQGTKLGDYLRNKGWSIEEFNKLIARSVRAAGIHTKEGAATAALALEAVLIQKYGIKIPYWRGGKTNSMGAYEGWGMYRQNPTYEGYLYYGMDCDGLVNWSYKNTGIDYDSILGNSYYFWSGLVYSKENGEIGDVLKTNGHVAIIIGKTNDYFIVAEAAGRDVGLIISKYPYNKEGYIIIKGERLVNTYQKIASKDYPTGF